MENGSKVGSFLITRGGLYKLVRRMTNNNMHYIEQISGCIPRELLFPTSNNTKNSNFVTTSLRGLMTKIVEPGKQFVLRVALFDNSQLKNPDKCFISEVCSQPLSLPLGKTRFLVRGSFESDRDAADHTEERTVMFTGKTTFVDFYLQFRLSDPTKLPDVIGKISVHGEGDVQFYINLHKSTQVLRVFLNMEFNTVYLIENFSLKLITIYMDGTVGNTALFWRLAQKNDLPS